MTTDNCQPPRPGLSEQPIELPPDDRSVAAMGLIGFAGVFNFFFCPIIAAVERGEAIWLFAPAGIGVLAAEIGLATLWLVWAPGSFGRRLVMHWGVAFGLYACFAIGLAAVLASHNNAHMIPRVLAAFLFSLPVTCLAAQIPLWPLRTHLGWRIERPSPVGNRSDASPSLSIRDMILATVVTSVSLGCLRFLAMLPNVYEPQFWPMWGIAVAIIAVASSFSLLPAIVMAFRIRETSGAAVAIGGYAVIAAFATCLIGSAIGGGAPAELFVAVFACICSFAMALALPLLVLASRGYRLTFASERRRADV